MGKKLHGMLKKKVIWRKMGREDIIDR